MKGYILRFRGEIVVVTNSPEDWLKDNNEQRKIDGNEEEDLSIFQIEEILLEMY